MANLSNMVGSRKASRRRVNGLFLLISLSASLVASDPAMASLHATEVALPSLEGDSAPVILLKDYLLLTKTGEETIGRSALIEMLDSETTESGKVQLDVAELVPDFDGDNRADIVHVRYVVSAGSRFYNGVLKVWLLRGKDGRSLWTTSFRIEESLPLVVPARLGKKTQDGLVVMNLGLTESYQQRVEVSGIDPRGKTSWEHSFEPDESVPGRTANAPMWPEVTPGGPGQASDVFTGLVTFTGADLGSAPVHALIAETSAAIIDGRSGDLWVDPEPETNWSTSPRPNQLEYQGEWVPTPLAAPDLNSDGIRDYMYVTALPRHDGRISARDREDGTELWSTSIPIGAFTDVTGGADLDGDREGDILITTFLFPSEREPALPHGDLMTALSGTDGTRLWSGTGSGARIIRDIDKDDVPDVVTSSTFFGEREAGIRYEGFSGSSGSPLYSRSHTLRSVGPYVNRILRTFHAEAGDVNEDRIGDSFFQQELREDGVDDQYASKVVSRRNGRSIASGYPWLPIGVSLDKRGADLLRVTSRGRQRKLEIAAMDGKTGKRLWTNSYHARNHGIGLDGFFASSFVAGERISSDGCNDVFLNLFDDQGGGFVLILDGRDGKELWAANLSNDGPDSIGERVSSKGVSGC